MAEKEYIERGALLTDEMTHTLPCSCGRSAGRVVVFVDDIEALPAADVVEVVRCKDCKSWDEAGVDPITNYHLGYCRHYQWQDKEYCDRETADNDFCSYGERKEQK